MSEDNETPSEYQKLLLTGEMIRVTNAVSLDYMGSNRWMIVDNGEPVERVRGTLEHAEAVARHFDETGEIVDNPPGPKWTSLMTARRKDNR